MLIGNGCAHHQNISNTHRRTDGHAGPDFATGSLFVGFGTGFSGATTIRFSSGLYNYFSKGREARGKCGRGEEDQLKGEKVLIRGDLEYFGLEIRFDLGVSNEIWTHLKAIDRTSLTKYNVVNIPPDMYRAFDIYISIHSGIILRKDDHNG